PLFIVHSFSLRNLCESSGLPLDFLCKPDILRTAIPSMKEAFRMFKWFQSLVSIRYQELNRMRRELRREAKK
ncbi:hypothetical protein, partial [Oscillibacter sp. CU971]|uniref:hypothetical protein n=1 Tax=Oscillibacter sp. CU971 TaxID=2780102 RepID=UPI001957EB11